MARVYIRQPWADLIVAGFKTIETAAHGLPDRYRGQWVDVQTEARETVGRVRFGGSFKYTDAGAFDADAGAHLVPEPSPYHFRNRARCYGWTVAEAERYRTPRPADPMPSQFRFSDR